ncbi:hypothetical protein XENOCAPTIV_016678, partial [Xenoophorus captivus]
LQVCLHAQPPSLAYFLTYVQLYTKKHYIGCWYLYRSGSMHDYKRSSGALEKDSLFPFAHRFARPYLNDMAKRIEKWITQRLEHLMNGCSTETTRDPGLSPWLPGFLLIHVVYLLHHLYNLGISPLFTGEGSDIWSVSGRWNVWVEMLTEGMSCSPGNLDYE